jgi:hypothetical protein
MALTVATALQAVGKGYNGNFREITSVLRGLINGDMLPEQSLAYLRARSYFEDDFLAAAIDARLSSTAGSGANTAAATTVAGAMNGTITMKSSDASGANSANATMLTFDQLNWKANQGGNVFEARLQVDVITNCYIFMGYTDTISTTVECPIGLTTVTPNSDADDAAGFMFDTSATNDFWHLGGVKATVDAAVINSNIAPVAATYQTLRVELDTSGGVTGYINGVLVGSIASALTATVGLTPALVISNRTATQKILTVDYIAANQNR